MPLATALLESLERVQTPPRIRDGRFSSQRSTASTGVFAHQKTANHTRPRRSAQRLHIPTLHCQQPDVVFLPSCQVYRRGKRIRKTYAENWRTTAAKGDSQLVNAQSNIKVAKKIFLTHKIVYIKRGRGKVTWPGFGQRPLPSGSSSPPPMSLLKNAKTLVCSQLLLLPWEIWQTF